MWRVLVPVLFLVALTGCLRAPELAAPVAEEDGWVATFDLYETSFDRSEFVLYHVSHGIVGSLNSHVRVDFDRSAQSNPSRACYVATLDRAPLFYTVTEPGAADPSIVGHIDRAEVHASAAQHELYAEVQATGSEFHQVLTVTSGARAEGQYALFGLEKPNEWVERAWSLQGGLRSNVSGEGFGLTEVDRGAFQCSSSWEGFTMEEVAFGFQGNNIGRGTYTWDTEDGLALSFKPPEPTKWKLEVRDESGVRFATTSDEKAAAWLRGGSTACIAGSGHWEISVEIEGVLNRQLGPNIALMDIGEQAPQVLPCLDE